MYTYEQTEKVETGLDVAIKDKDGVIIAWAYTKDCAMAICIALNKVTEGSK